MKTSYLTDVTNIGSTSEHPYVIQETTWGFRKSGLVRKPDEKKPFYEISDKGRDYLENPLEQIEAEEPKVTTEGNHVSKLQKILRKILREILQGKLQRPSLPD